MIDFSLPSQGPAFCLSPPYSGLSSFFFLSLSK
jgi:hypothetical protein